jgi:hypothetical protein
MQTLSAGHMVMPPNKALQLTANPLRGFSAAELGRSAAIAYNECGDRQTA